MNQQFRDSEFIDFNTGTVKIAPIQLQFRLRMAGELHAADPVRLFQCRVEVWHLGVAAQMVRTIEFSQPPEVWSHAAYALLALLVPYFEMVGQLVNPAPLPTDALAPHTLPENFAHGFHDVYGNLTTSSGDAYDPLEFYNLARHSLYGRGSKTQGLWMHNSPSISTQDFDIVFKKPDDLTTRKLYVNPHAVVRTVIDHFPEVIARLNNPATEHDGLRARFQHYYGDHPEV